MKHTRRSFFGIALALPLVFKAKELPETWFGPRIKGLIYWYSNTETHEEALVYDRALDRQEIETVRLYLKDKHGL